MKRTVAILLIGVLILSFLIVSAQKADAQSNTLIFTALGDRGATDDATAAVASMINVWNPDLIITMGDNYHASGGGVGSEKYDLSTGQYYCSFLKDVTTTGALCPTGQASINRFFPAVGDHDYTDAGTIDNLPSTYTDYFNLPGDGYTSSSNNERYYDFVSGPVHFFMLNGLEQPGLEPDGSDIFSAQAQWLRTQLGASTSIWNVVVVHKPPYSSGTKHGGAEHIQWPFAQWGADVVFSGHEHNYERILRDGIVYFVNGLGGDWIYPLGEPIEGSAFRYNANHGAQRVIATDQTMTFEFYSIENGGTLIDTYTITEPHPTATPTYPLFTTGWHSPTTDWAQTGTGDNNGYEANPAYAFANDGLAAMDMDSGTSAVANCRDPGKDKHKFFNYHISIPEGSTVEGIQVRLDAHADSSVGAPKLCVTLSWDNGVSWLPWRESPVLSDTEKSYGLGWPSDTWGRSWTAAELSDASFQLRIANIAVNDTTDFSLDWVAVNVTYNVGPANTPTGTPTVTESPTTTPTASQTQTETPTATPTASSTATETLTFTPTYTEEPPATDTPTDTPTATETNTATPEATASLTATSSETATPTASGTATDVAPLTATSTDTPTSTALPSTPTCTPTASQTQTATATDTATSPPSSTPTDTPSPTPTSTATHTSTSTPTATKTATPTSSRTPTATRTLTATATQTSTAVHTATVPPAPVFTDVLADYWASPFVQRLYAAGITGGCSLNPPQYCPEATVTRAQMAVFLERGIHGSSYSPPAVAGSTGFGDVAPAYWAAAWIKQLAAEGITSGCGSGDYCPEHPVTRAQMAVFLLRAKHGTGYTPPPIGESTGFSDIPNAYWAAAWIKQLVTDGITAGCGNGNYCPESPVTRAQMAVFLVKTFSLP